MTLLGDTVFGCPPSVHLGVEQPLGHPRHRREFDGGNGLQHDQGRRQPNVASSASTVDPTLGNIDVQNGILSIETTTTGLGNPSQHADGGEWRHVAPLQRDQPVQQEHCAQWQWPLGNNLGTLNNGSGNNTVAGPMTLNGSVEVTFRTSPRQPAGGSVDLEQHITGGRSAR